MDLIFDVNGTITNHGKPITHPIMRFMEELCKQHRVVLISGVAYEVVREKLQTLTNKVHAVYGSAGNEKFVNDGMVYSKRVYFSARETSWIDSIVDGDVRVEQCRLVLPDVNDKEKTCDLIEDKFSHLTCCINTTGNEVHVLRRDSDKTQILHEYSKTAVFFTDRPDKYQYDYTLSQRLITMHVKNPLELPHMYQEQYLK